MTFRPSSHRSGTVYTCGICFESMVCACPVVDLTAAEAARLAGLPPRTVQSWAASGLITPSMPLPPVDVSYVYGFNDLMAMRFAAELRRERVTTWIVELAVAEFRRFEVRLRSLVNGSDELWAITPTDPELAEDVRAEGLGMVGLFDEAARLGFDRSEPLMHHEFACRHAALELEDSIQTWLDGRGAERPEWL